jgi:hypothetical protein
MIPPGCFEPFEGDKLIVRNVTHCVCGGKVDRICSKNTDRHVFFETLYFLCACCGRRGDPFIGMMDLERLMDRKRKAISEKKIDLSGSIGIIYDETTFLGTTELFQALDRLSQPLDSMIRESMLTPEQHTKLDHILDAWDVAHREPGDSRDAQGKTWRDRGPLA